MTNLVTTNSTLNLAASSCTYFEFFDNLSIKFAEFQLPYEDCCWIIWEISVADVEDEDIDPKEEEAADEGL